MAHGERASKHHGREYWSRRLPGMVTWGRVGKWLTHRRERTKAKRVERELRSDPNKWDDLGKLEK